MWINSAPVFKNKLKSYVLFFKWKTQNIKPIIRRNSLSTLHRINSKLVPNKEISIVSEDCVGGAIYQFLGKPYQSPTVGLWISCNDYLRFIKELQELESKELIFDYNHEFSYPIAYLNGIRIGFQHYQSEDEAKKSG